MRRAWLRCVAWGALLALTSCGEQMASPWSAEPALDLDLRLQVEPHEVGLMQPVTITLDRFRKQDIEVVFEAAVDEAKWLETARVVGEEQPLFGGRWQRTTLTVLPIVGPGEITLDEFVAHVAGDEARRATTAAQMIAVGTALADHDKQQIEAPGKPFATPLRWWPWLLASAGGLALVVLWLWWRRRARQPRPATAEVAVPAHIKALRELARWRGARCGSDAEVEAFYVGTSQVLRVYLEERFGLRAPERTTEEFLRDLESGDALAREHRRELEGFLSRCDLVKFAAHQPSASEHEAVHDLAVAFVESTRPDRLTAEAST